MLPYTQYMHTLTRTVRHTQTYVYTHMHAHTHICTYTHQIQIHTHAYVQSYAEPDDAGTILSNLGALRNTVC